MLSIIYGLSSALIWGAADFSGGLASRKSKAHHAVLWGDVIGLCLLLGMTLLYRESPLTWQDWVMCSLAGVMGVFGLLIFFIYLSKGQMTIAAPVSALSATILPIIVGSVLDGSPGIWKFAGFALALASIWFISLPQGGSKNVRLRLKDLAMPLIAGAGFGVYLVLFERGSQDHLLWPLITARTSGTLTMLLYTLFRRQQFLPTTGSWLFIALYGVLDITGNGLYILAGQAGRMDVAAVLVSLYPASTVLLAWWFLHEKISRLQFAGILAALIAIIMMMI